MPAIPVLDPDFPVLKLTQAQLRDLVGINEEQYRSWRQALPPLRNRSGRSQQFGGSDVLALLIIEAIVERYGAKISKFSDIAFLLFDRCEELLRSPGPMTHIVISPDRVTLAAPATLAARLEDVGFVVPIRPLLNRITAPLLEANREEAQLTFL